MLNLLAALAAVLLAVSFHELAHGWAARRLGDDTAYRAGRMTLNPMRHVDPIGTLLVPGVLLAAKSPFLFGWAKPVPVDWRRLRRPRRDMALVALAGPGANLLMLAGWVLLAGTLDLEPGDLLPGTSDAASPLLYLIGAGIIANTILMTVNLLPIPPLDGGRVAAALLPPALGERYGRLEPFGLLIVVLLLATGLLGVLLQPVMYGIWRLVGRLLAG